MKLKFYKMSSAGNDFILIPECSTGALHQLAKKLCARRLSIGADGLLLLKRKSDKILKVRYYNSDGSEAFCANGSRCAAWFAYSKKIISENSFYLYTIKGILPVKISGHEKVILKMPDVNSISFNFTGKYPAGIKQVHFLNTGVPHAVVPVKDINKLNVESLGKAIRFNKCFGKEGANVDFTCLKKGIIHLRTYERGVEAETLACGTGSVASAIALGILHKLKQPVRCVTKGGETFRVWFKADDKNSVKEVYLEGPARIIFEGEIDIVED